MDAQSEKLNEFNIKYDELKEKVVDIKKQFRELTNQHTKNNGLFYIFKRDILLLQNEMDSINRLRDQIRRELSIVD